MKLTVVTPVLNDWASCRTLLQNIDAQFLPGIAELDVLIVDDGSTEAAPAELCAGLGRGSVGQVSVVELACNVGHQRAIALGLGVAEMLDDGAHVLVMDADGEDNPAEIPKLLAALSTEPDGVAVAGRSSRSEGTVFRAGYFAYQALFRILVGKRIEFGNFSLFGPAVLQRLVRMPETWNHVAASLLRSRLKLLVVPTSRGTRYAGRSSMNLPSLVAHGLSAFAVFFDSVFARLLLFACALAAVCLTGASVVAFLRLATDMATPGWATAAVGVFLTIMLQMFLLVLVASVQMLATRSQPGVQPRALVPQFVLRTTPVFRAGTGSSQAAVGARENMTGFA